MIFTNQEKLLKFLDVEDDIEANPAKSIEEEDTELVNCHGHDHLQDLLLITGIPLIAIDSNKEDANDKGKCKDNEGSRQRNDRSSSSCTASSDIAGGSLTSYDLFLCGLMLGIFLVGPAIHIFLFTPDNMTVELWVLIAIIYPCSCGILCGLLLWDNMQPPS